VPIISALIKDTIPKTPSQKQIFDVYLWVMIQTSLLFNVQGVIIPKKEKGVMFCMNSETRTIRKNKNNNMIFELFKSYPAPNIKKATLMILSIIKRTYLNLKYELIVRSK